MRAISSATGILRSASRAAERLAHVALNQAAIRPPDFRNRLAGEEMLHLIDVHARIGLAPAKNRNSDHTVLRFRARLVVNTRPPSLLPRSHGTDGLR